MRLEIHPAYVTTLPSGLTVGDEFRIAGRVRVVAVAEETVDVSVFGDHQPRLTGGDLTVTVRLLDVKEES